MSTLVCPHCGRDNADGNKYCKYCRKNLRRPSDPNALIDDDMPIIMDSDNLDYSISDTDSTPNDADGDFDFGGGDTGGGGADGDW